MDLSVDIAKEQSEDFVRVRRSCRGDGQLVLDEDVHQKFARCLQQLIWTYIAKCIMTIYGLFCGPLFWVQPG
jgi:hypothetical protein